MAANKDLTQPLVGDEPHAYIEMNAPGSQPAAPAPEPRPAGDWLRPWPLTAVVLFLVNVALIVGVTILGTKLADRSQCVSYPAPNAQDIRANCIPGPGVTCGGTVIPGPPPPAPPPPSGFDIKMPGEQ